MTTTLARGDLVGALQYLLEEVFVDEDPGNAFLDHGTSWQSSLQELGAEAASRSLVPGGTTIAAHVEHTRFYLGVLREFARGRTERVDWRLSWQVTSVDEDQWRELRDSLQEEYRQVSGLIRNNPEWDEGRIGTVMAAIAHSAYHLGAIRQMIMAVQTSP